MRTLLLNPPSAFEGKFVSREQGGIGTVEERFLPSEMLITAAYLRRAGHEVDVADVDGRGPDLSRYDAVVVWVCILHTYHADLDWLRRAKEAGCRTVMVLNDPYGDFEAQTLARHPFIDAAVRLWERPLSLEALFRSWQAGTRAECPGLVLRDGEALVDTGLHAQEDDLSYLVTSAGLLEGQPLDGYDAVGITPGRGCGGRHSFCLFGQSVQHKRPVADVLAEVEAVAGRTGRILILDPDMAGTRAWTEQFCRELSARGLPVRWRADLRPEQASPPLLKLLRDAGCDEVMVAVQTLDSGVARGLRAGQSPAMLRRALRDIRDAGIRPILFFYVGWPWDSEESLDKVRQFLRQEPVASFYLKQVRPWPGTPLHERFLEMGLLEGGLSPDDFVRSGSPLCPTLHLSPEQQERWKRRIGRAAMLRPRYVWRFLRERRIRPRHVAQFVSLALGRNIFRGK